MHKGLYAALRTQQAHNPPPHSIASMPRMPCQRRSDAAHPYQAHCTTQQHRVAETGGARSIREKVLWVT